MSTKIRSKVRTVPLRLICICICVIMANTAAGLTVQGSATPDRQPAADHPDYIRQGYLVAHAMGILDGRRTFTSSLEAFQQNYAAGHRVFEVDLQLTSDGELITLHERYTTIYTFDYENNSVPYTLMRFEDICHLMLQYDDFYLITDTKYIDEERNRKSFDIISEAISTIIPGQEHRVAIQFYNQQMYYFLKDNYDFPADNYMYTLYGSPDTDQQVIQFVKSESIQAVVMRSDRALANGFALMLKDEGLHVYAHTVNKKDIMENLFGNGVYGIYTDILTYDQPEFTRLGRYAAYTQGLSKWAQEQVPEAISIGLVPRHIQSIYTQATTRAEFCALAVCLYETAIGDEVQGRASFTDTADVCVEKMAWLGVVNGVGDGRFNPDGALTREQAATILSGLAAAIGKDLPMQSPSFSDNESISTWAVDAVGQLQATGIMGGTGDNAFSPKGPYTREQSIATILRLYKTVN